MQNPAFVQEVVRLTNQYRVANGRSVLSVDVDLTEAAQSYSETMAIGDFFSHIGPGGSYPWDRAQQAGYETGIVGENIGVGYPTPKEIVNAWIASDSHRAAMLNPRYNEIGVGYYFLKNDTGFTNYNTYWSQLFGQGEIEVLTADGNPAIFDPLQYGASYGDLIATLGFNLAAFEQHYIAFGQAEGRERDRFNESRYLASNPDLIGVLGDDLTAATEHYVRHGYFEGRSTDRFGPLQYLASQPDVLTAGGLDPEAAAMHYIRFGLKEGRSDKVFDAARYLASNIDLIQHFGYDTEGASAHYIQHGMGENRSTTAFDPAAYLGLYADLQGAFGNNLAAATRHYVQFGFTEGRATGA